MQTTDPSVSERRNGGQALAEFALVVPLLAFVIAGIIQFGLIFWSQQTLTQIARDTGRWAATQVGCSTAGVNVAGKAEDIADNSALFGFNGSFKNVSATWRTDIGSCPPVDNQDETFIIVTIDHDIPVFFPFVPGNGSLSTTAEFRMEPEPA